MTAHPTTSIPPDPAPNTNPILILSLILISNSNLYTKPYITSSVEGPDLCVGMDQRVPPPNPNPSEVPHLVPALVQLRPDLIPT